MRSFKPVQIKHSSTWFKGWNRLEHGREAVQNQPSAQIAETQFIVRTDLLTVAPGVFWRVNWSPNTENVCIASWIA